MNQTNANTKQPINILGIGEVVLDKSNILPTHPTDGSKVQSLRTKYSVGGPVPAALILLSRLGAKCTLICSLGNDDAAQIILQKLHAEGINVIIKSQSQTKTNTVLVNSLTGSRTIIKDQVEHHAITQIDNSLLAQAHAVIFDRHEPQAYHYVIKHKPAHTQIVIDPSTEISAKTLFMIKTANLPIIPIESLKQIKALATLQSKLDYLYELGHKPFIITLDKWGSLYYDGQTIDYHPPYKIKVVDTLGAGDIYRGAIAYGIIRQWSLRKTINYANLIAAIQCTRVGNGSAIPYKHEIQQLGQIYHRHNWQWADVSAQINQLIN